MENLFRNPNYSNAFDKRKVSKTNILTSLFFFFEPVFDRKNYLKLILSLLENLILNAFVAGRISFSHLAKTLEFLWRLLLSAKSHSTSRNAEMINIETFASTVFSISLLKFFFIKLKKLQTLQKIYHFL